jgi:glycosyltransferase involved in cell wall biosynthesis
MAKVIFLPRFGPSDIGTGAHHRSYQILHDIKNTIGESNIVSPKLEFILPSFPYLSQKARWAQLPIILRKRVALFLRYCLYLGNPNKLLPYMVSYIHEGRHQFGSIHYETYDRLVASVEKPSLCIIDHPAYLPIVKINRKAGIPTIYCPQNIEAFDSGNLDLEKEWNKYALAYDFIQELEMISTCDERLCISRVEAGLLGGLGLPSYYYPYLPVGEIKEHFDWIRNQRCIKDIEPNTFLMLGTAIHQTTGDAFKWFLNNAQTQGLPEGVRVIVAGTGTETLLDPKLPKDGLDVKGWISQSDLDDLLIHVGAVLIPQLSGFGALTRLVEMSSAGIPTVVSRHPTFSMILPPGVDIVDDNWQNWNNKIDEFSRDAQIVDQKDYDEWEKNQINPMSAIIHKYIPIK